MAIKCFSLGAAQEVTGSKHIFQIDDRMFMVDCGAFQGKRKESDQKNRNFQIDTERLESVILTHGHLDHCGLLPPGLLRHSGNQGPHPAVHRRRPGLQRRGRHPAVCVSSPLQTHRRADHLRGAESQTGS